MNKFKSFKEFSTAITNISPLTSGWRGQIYTAMYNGTKIAIKTPRNSNFKNSIKTEIENLKKLQHLDFVPKLINYGENFFAYPFIEGIHFNEIFKNIEQNFLLIKKIIFDLIEKMFILDKIGLKKNEMSRPFGNIIISPKNEVKIIDFEKSRFQKYWCNMPQLLQFLKKNKIFGLDLVIDLGLRYEFSPTEVKKEIEYNLTNWIYNEN